MMNTAFRLLLLSAVALGASGLTHAQTSVPRDKTTPGVEEATGGARSADPQRAIVERADAAARAFQQDEITDPTVFVKSAALGALTGVELAKLAETKSQNTSIQSFAGRLLKSHTAIRTELAAIAKRKRLDVPTSLVYEDEQMVEQAAEKSGAEFDGWFVRQMITEQDKAIALFRGATNMDDKDLAAFAKKTLPALNEQQKMAIALTDAPSP
jgi:predicted outer membrane protein